MLQITSISWIAIILGVIFTCQAKAYAVSPGAYWAGTPDTGIPDTLIPVVKSDAEWKASLSQAEYTILRQKGTEAAYTGMYWDHHAQGLYLCRGCQLPLFSSVTKFHSGTGWPSFYEPVDKAAVRELDDFSHGMDRIEVQCARCGGHLGHVFQDGPRPTGLRYCINSLALTFQKKNKK